VNLLLCRYSSIHSTCLVLASHRPILMPRSGRLQGNTFSMHSDEDPVVVVLVFPPISYILVSQCLIHAELLHKKMQSESFVFLHSDKFRALYKKTSVSAILFSRWWVYPEMCYIKTRLVSAILFVERCTKQIFRNVLSL
jgi:hypothetical protein